MADPQDKRISDLTPATLPLTGAEILPMDQSGVTLRATAQDIVNLGKNVSAASRILGRGSSAGAGPQQELTIDSTLQLTGTVLSVTPGTYGNAQTANPLSQFAATTSNQLAGVLTDETGSGSVVFSISPTLTGPTLTSAVVGTQASTDNSTLAASTAYVTSAVSTAVASVSTSFKINAQTGASYAVLATDVSRHLTFSNATSVAVTLSQATTTGFTNGFFFLAENIGTGAVTITPTTSTINALAAVVLDAGMSAIVMSDGANYRAFIIERNGISVNAQTGTAYTFLSGDRGRLLAQTNAAASAYSLPQATGAFGANWFTYVQNRGAGTLTITPATSTIDGATTLALTTGQGCLLASDGANYFTVRGIGGGGGGGLTNFTDTLNTTAPNATVPVSVLSATNAATNVDITVLPKGTGAFMLAIPDNTATGGNKRGTNAVDLQTSIGSAARVASGQYAFCVGSGNTASSIASIAMGFQTSSSANYAVSIGYQSVASALYAVAIGHIASAVGQSSVAIGGDSCSATQPGAGTFAGSSLVASGTSAVALGGATLNASGQNSAALGGASNTLSGLNSVAIGKNATDRVIQNALVHGAPFFSAQGDNQFSRVPVSAITTDATPTVATVDRVAASSTNTMRFPAAVGRVFTGKVVVHNPTTGDTAGWTVSGLSKTVTNVPSIVGTPAITLAGSDSALTSASIAVGVDATNKALQLTVTGIAATTLHWSAFFEMVDGN